MAHGDFEPLTPKAIDQVWIRLNAGPEGDLVFGKGMSPIVTLVERSTRFVMLVSLPRGDRSSRATRAPARASRRAVEAPATRPPTTTAS